MMKSGSRSAPLVQSITRRKGARARLYCLPHAGGGASAYRPWAATLSEQIDLLAVQLPGREERFQERPLEGMEAVLDRLTDEMAANEIPAAIFGHSMGAIIAWELARRLRALGLTWPVHLFVSGCRAPHTRDPYLARLHRQDDQTVLAELRRLNGTPADILGNDELMTIMLPTLRADLALLGEHTADPADAVDVPLTAFGGRFDPSVAPEHLVAWSLYTTSRFDSQLLPGDHFYFRQPATLHLLTASVGRRLLDVIADETPRSTG